MKMLYVTYYDTNNVKEWSGIPYHMLRAARNVFEDVEVIGPLKVPFRWINRLMFRFCMDILGVGYVREAQKSFLKDYAREVEKRLNKTSGDIIFCDSIYAVAELETELPVVTWGDATVKCLRDHYYPNERLMYCAASDQAQKKAIQRTNLCVLTSEWAVQSAVNDYGADDGKMIAVPFGANLESAPQREWVEKNIYNKNLELCQLLLVGVDWMRKGVDLAVDVARYLHEEGVQVKLTVVGCEKPSGVSLPDYIHVEGFVDKQTQEGAKKIKVFFENSHFLLFPSRAEAFGIVACEASAYGVPTISSNVGGIANAVRNKANGFTFSLDNYVQDAVSMIKKLIDDQKMYHELALSSRNVFEKELNWEKGFKKIKEHFKK